MVSNTRFAKQIKVLTIAAFALAGSAHSALAVGEWTVSATCTSSHGSGNSINAPFVSCTVTCQCSNGFQYEVVEFEDFVSSPPPYTQAGLDAACGALIPTNPIGGTCPTKAFSSSPSSSSPTPPYTPPSSSPSSSPH